MKELVLCPRCGQPVMASYPRPPSLRTCARRRLASEIQHAGDDQSRKLYPTDTATAIMTFAVGTIAPRPVNQAVLNSRADEAERAKLDAPAREARRVFAERQAIFEAAKKYAYVAIGYARDGLTNLGANLSP